jgi:hypothetical protein
VAIRASAQRGSFLLKTTFKGLRGVLLCLWCIDTITAATHRPAAATARLTG